jgi:hypothetical protein
MGQQQLLLLVLGIVIVGLAVVVGIQAFGENQRKSNQDALVNDGVRIASDAQAWALKPTAFGGGNGSLAGADFGDLGYVVGDNNSTPHTAGAAEYENINGEFSIGASGTGLLITGESFDPSGLATSTTAENTVYVRVCGTDQDDITTQVGGSAPSACT